MRCRSARHGARHTEAETTESERQGQQYRCKSKREHISLEPRASTLAQQRQKLAISAECVASEAPFVCQCQVAREGDSEREIGSRHRMDDGDRDRNAEEREGVGRDGHGRRTAGGCDKW
eukprot:5837070-Prymnesium_polylepis.1